MGNTYTMEDLYSKGTPVTGIQSAVDGMNKEKTKASFTQGMRTGEESLAGYLAQMEADRQAQAVIEAQRADVLGRIQQDIQNGIPVPPEAAGLYNQSVSLGQGMPAVGPDGQPVYYNTGEY